MPANGMCITPKCDMIQLSLQHPKKFRLHTGFDTPPDSIVLEVRGAMTNDFCGDRYSKWIFRVSNIPPFSSLGFRPKDLRVIHENFREQRVDTSKTRLVATDRDGDALRREKSAIIICLCAHDCKHD
jgi:hypothetical protein